MLAALEWLGRANRGLSWATPSNKSFLADSMASDEDFLSATERLPGSGPASSLVLRRKGGSRGNWSLAHSSCRIACQTRFLNVIYLLFVLLLSDPISATRLSSPVARYRPSARQVREVKPAILPFLDVFQVTTPILQTARIDARLPDNDGAVKDGGLSDVTVGSLCLQTLVDYSFGSSYGQPFIGLYHPPSCAYNAVTFNLTVVSRGTQFDRLALMYFGDVEILRTSTAEPTSDGIQWTYIKDMTNYLSLFNSSQKIIFDLGNLVGGRYTASFNVTVTATFSTQAGLGGSADLILPVSARRSSLDAVSAFVIPQDNASSSIIIPRNVHRAIFTISACGQADEEFWFGNVLSSDTDTFPSAALLGHSPFRELQLWIDGVLTGVAWPFPIIFTGGVVPGLWRPMVGIDAFDLREREIDITAWLPALCDGAVAGHTFEIRVAGIEDNGAGQGHLSASIGNDWVVTGKLFLWLDEPGSITTGTMPSVTTAQPEIEITSAIVAQEPEKDSIALEYSVKVRRELSVSSVVVTSNGSRREHWSQSLDYLNNGYFTNEGLLQLTNQSTAGTDISSSGYTSSYKYPILVNTTYATDNATGNFSIEANIYRSLEYETLGKSVFPSGLRSFNGPRRETQSHTEFQGSSLSTVQNGSAHYQFSPISQISTSSGSTEQKYVFSGIRSPTGSRREIFLSPDKRELYSRHVLASHGGVIQDRECLVGRCTVHSPPKSDLAVSQIYARVDKIRVSK